ncbi:MAG: response regulator [Polyangiaceae bacterium]
MKRGQQGKPAASEVPGPSTDRANDPGSEAMALHWEHSVSGPLTALVGDLDLAYEVLAHDDGRDVEARIEDAVRRVGQARQAAERIRVVALHAQLTFGVASQPTHPSGPPDSSPQRRRVRVLIVDDDIQVGKALQRCLCDHDVVVLDSGTDAVERLTAGDRFDLILSDLMMPGMTGADLHDQIARIAPEQAERMVFLSGGFTTPRVQKFVANVRNRVMDKPFDLNELRDLVRSTRPVPLSLIVGPIR